MLSSLANSCIILEISDCLTLSWFLSHPFSAFNNILSNLGHVLLGFLFLLIVLRRDILHRRALDAKDIFAKVSRGWVNQKWELQGLWFQTGATKGKNILLMVIMVYDAWGQAWASRFCGSVTHWYLSVDHAFSFSRSMGFPNTSVSSMLWASHWWWKECSVLVTTSALITPTSNLVIRIYINNIDLSYRSLILGPSQKCPGHTRKN